MNFFPLVDPEKFFSNVVGDPDGLGNVVGDPDGLGIVVGDRRRLCCW